MVRRSRVSSPGSYAGFPPQPLSQYGHSLTCTCALAPYYDDPEGLGLGLSAGLGPAVGATIESLPEQPCGWLDSGSHIVAWPLSLTPAWPDTEGGGGYAG